jgi:Aspartyl protease
MGWPTRTALSLAHASAIALISIVVGPRAQAAERCTLGKVAELPVTMAGYRPLVTAGINGKEARFVLDSGAFYSLMTTATAAEFGLKLERAPRGAGM